MPWAGALAAKDKRLPRRVSMMRVHERMTASTPVARCFQRMQHAMAMLVLRALQV